MNTTLQPILPFGETIPSDLTLYLERDQNVYDVYLGVALLERVNADPAALDRKMLVGRLYNAGAPLSRLKEVFGHEGRTVKKWGKALLSTDVDEVVRAFGGRSGKRKVTPELVRYVQQLYLARDMLPRNYREEIIKRTAEVFQVRISTTTASAIFASVAESSGPDPCASDAGTGSQMEEKPASDCPDSVKQSPTPMPAQTGSVVPGPVWVHHAGQVLFVAGMKDFDDPFQRQLLGQILQGAVNVEQSKTLCGSSLSNFTGPVVNTLQEQRQRLDELACSDTILEIYARNAALLPDGPNRGDLFYFDPHTQEYTGQLKTLKDWSGACKRIVKAVHLDAFHTQSGRACFIQHYSPYYDLRERFFLSRAMFDQLFVPEKRWGRIFIIDRGIYSLPVLRSFGDDDVLTWEKDYSGGGWDEDRPVTVFDRSVPKNRGNDLRTTHFECQQMPWERDPSFRKIVVRATRDSGKTIEVSIITTNQDMDVEDVVWAIFRRWLQENDFKYLDAHFGLNQLTSRDSYPFRERAAEFIDRPVDSPEYKELKRTLGTLGTQLGKALTKQRKLEKELVPLEQISMRLEAERPQLITRLEESLDCLRAGRSEPRGHETLLKDAAARRKAERENRRKLGKNAERREQLESQIRQTEAQILSLEEQLCQTVRKQSRVELLSAADCQMLDTRKKSLMDALRITAGNIFRNVQQQYRTICDNFRDDHFFVRMLSRCSGTINRTHQAATVRLWIPGTLQPHRISNLEQLLKHIERETNKDFPMERPVRIGLLTGPVGV